MNSHFVALDRIVVMDMDAIEERSGSNDHTMIMKGKRTKRQRPLSPAGRVTSSSSSGGGGEKSGCSDGGDFYNNSLVPCSSEISTSTEEDEDMANCLILLAQGGCIIKQEEEEIKMEKFSSRRLNEMVTTSTTAKGGFYVYECKTCNRTFPSFQALGGHRAGHKKPKPMVEEKKVVVATISVDQEEQEEEDGRQFIRPNDPSQSMELSNKASHGNNKSSKIHECSICGSEFSSGQALGGHMRRHRNPTSTKPTVDHSEKPSSIFPLDLNLPAPEDHDHRDLKFQFAANQQHLVFSAPALVDCHY